MASESGWTVYTLHAALWSATPEAILLVVANIVLVRAIIRTGAAVTWGLAVSCAWAFALGAFVMLGGWAALGAVLGLAYAGQVGPSIWSTYRVQAPTGIAPTYWVANLVEAGLWGLYGTVHRDRAVVLFALVAMAAAGLILIRWSTMRWRLGDDWSPGRLPVGGPEPTTATLASSQARGGTA